MVEEKALELKAQATPTATKLLLDAARKIDLSAIKSVYLVYCPTTSFKGTGFLTHENQVVTCRHVIKGEDPTKIVLRSAMGETYGVKAKTEDPGRDMAVLSPINDLGPGLEIADTDLSRVGERIWTWGFPLGYNGPAPLLSVGYLSGYSHHSDPPDYPQGTKHYVVNGAFNPGNSGGPVFCERDEKVVGVVASKHAPLSKFVASALSALANNASGIVFTGWDEKGAEKNYVESQVVAEVLEYYRSLTQVMIGEAIAVSELSSFTETLRKKTIA